MKNYEERVKEFEAEQEAKKQRKWEKENKKIAKGLEKEFGKEDRKSGERWMKRRRNGLGRRKLGVRLGIVFLGAAVMGGRKGKKRGTDRGDQEGQEKRARPQGEVMETDAENAIMVGEVRWEVCQVEAADC